MIGGWVKAHRSRFENPLFTKPYCRGYAWDWICAAACHRPTKFDIKGKTVTLERGQLATSYRKMAEAWGWSLGAVQRFVTRLKTDTMIETTSDTGQLIITICNYNNYQTEEQQTDTPSDTPADTEAIQERYTKEEGKEGEEKKVARKRAHRLPADWQLSDRLRQWARAEGLTDAEVEFEAAQFRDYWHSASGQNASKLDWDKAFQVWARKASNRKPQRRRREVREGQDWLEYDDAFGGGPVYR